MDHKFLSLKIGQSAQFIHQITEHDVKRFVELTGDNNPLHVNTDFAKRTVFKERVAHGMLGGAFISTLIGKYLPGEGALWVSQELDFLLPVRIGDTLTISAKIIEKYESQRLLVLCTEIHNQHQQLVVSGKGKVKCLEIETIELPPAVKQKKVVLITGGSRGIGRETALYLAKLGYAVMINYMKDDHSAENIVAKITENGGEALCFKADVSDERAVNKMIDDILNHYDTITDLVYGASSRIITQDFLNLTWDQMDAHFSVQLKGAFYCVQRLIKDFIQYQSGRIVFLGSIATDNVPPLKMTGYVAAKSALQSFAKSLAHEFGPQGIRVNVVAPGMTQTSLIADIPEKARLLTKMQTPLRRLAYPEDIASAIAFLLSEESSHITGETLRICGGQLMV